MELILDKTNRPQGPRVANICLRPLRIAYLVPDNDPVVVRRVIHSCCLTWGGALNPLIPYSKTEGLSQLWLNILQTFDPDNLVDCVGISESDKRALSAQGRYIHQWEKPSESFFMVGALQYSALRAFHRGFRNRENDRVIQPKIQQDENGLSLCAAAILGELDQRFMESTLEYHGYIKSARYADFANITEVDFTNYAKGVFLDDVPHEALEGRTGIVNWYTLISLTKVGLQFNKTFSFTEEPASGGNIIVTGKKNCVTDLCLFWNLRIDHPFNQSLPLWIPFDSLLTEDGLRIANTAIARADNDKRMTPGVDSSLYVVSTSLTLDTLRDKLNGKLGDAKFQTDGLRRFISGNADYYLTKEEREVHFKEGNVRVPISPNQSFSQFAPHDRVIHEISFAGLKFPQSESLKEAIWWNIHRLSSKGFAGFTYISGWPDTAVQIS